MKTLIYPPPANLENLNKKIQLLKSTAMTTPNNLDDFSKREIQVMLFSLEGLSVMEIADLLNLSKHTIKRHKENIADKAGTKGSCQMRQFLKQVALLIEKNKAPD